MFLKNNMPIGYYYDLLAQIEDLRKDFEKFYLKGTKISGTRIRAGLQEVKKKIYEVRKDIQKNKKENDKIKCLPGNKEAAIARGKALGARRKKA
mgnify:CR=1 FL=1